MMRNIALRALGMLLGLLFCHSDVAGAEEANYEEANVSAYTLPDPLLLNNGQKVTSAAAWHHQRRPELIELFETSMYGKRPANPEDLKFEVKETDRNALDGKATRKQIYVDFFGKGAGGPGMTMTLYVPNGAKKPVPAFVGMHLFDTAAKVPMPGKALNGDVGRALPGTKLMETILDRGYAVATLDAKHFCADDKEKFREGVLKYLAPNQSGAPAAEEAGAIAVWAWGLSRALDYFETDPDIDARRVTVLGHSRMGKTALWAGAQDERFAIVISNNSGCAGAALSRRNFGESIERIKRVFPHWFCGNLTRYADKEANLPVDQHELIALIAPRPVYVASAVDDRWADPKGEFLAATGAESVYKLLGKRGLGTCELPPLNQSVGGTIGYHIRDGKHDLTDFDWLLYLDFADRHFGRKP